MHTHDIIILVCMIIPLAFCIWILFQGFKKFRLGRIIEDLPTSKARSVALGLVEVFGEVNVRNKDKLISPFTKEDCVYYEYKIEEYKKEGEHSRWITMMHEKKAVPFYLKDDTGTVLVDLQNANVNIVKDNLFDSGLGKNPPQCVQEFLKEKSINYEGWLGFNKRMKFTEAYIEPDTIMYVLGTAENYSSAKGTPDLGDGIVIKKSKEDMILIASDKPEREIVSQIKLQSFGLIACGLFLLSIFTLVVLKGLGIW
jgi:hypothetical protein